MLKSPTKRIRIMTQGVENPEPLIVKREEYFNSPNIRTPADSQTLDEFKGIFTLSSPQPVYSPLKSFLKRGSMDVRSSPVQRVETEETSSKQLWWMDDAEETKEQNWLKEEQVEELLDSTEDDKKKFFQALLNNEIQPEFSDSEDSQDSQELLESIHDLNSEIEKLSNSQYGYSQDFKTEETQMSENQLENDARHDTSSENGSNGENGVYGSESMRDKSSVLKQESLEISEEISADSQESLENSLEENLEKKSGDNSGSGQSEESQEVLKSGENTPKYKSRYISSTEKGIESLDFGNLGVGNDQISSTNQEINSFTEQEITSYRDSGDVTPKLKKKKPNNAIEEFTGDDSTGNQVFEQLKQDLENQSVGFVHQDAVGEVESDSEIESDIEIGDSKVVDKNIKLLQTDNGQVSISFAAVDDSTILLDGERAISNSILPVNDESILPDILLESERMSPSLLESKQEESLALEKKSSSPLPDNLGLSNTVNGLDIATLKIDHSPVKEQNSVSRQTSPSHRQNNAKSVDREELRRIQTVVYDLQAQLKDLEQELVRKDAENDNLKKESVLLESILAKEQSNSRRLLSRMGGVNQADINQLRKEIEDQERLIHGYQLENERLIDQNKDLKMQIKEVEKKEILKSEKLTREINALKMQLNERDRFQNRSELGVATYQLQIETLEQELQSLKSSSLETSEFQIAEIEKLKAMLKEANKSKTKKEVSANHHIETSHAYLDMKDKYDAQIIELEHKLKSHLENQEMVDNIKKNMFSKDIRIKELEDSIEKLVPNSGSKKDLRRRSLVDINKINSLEAEIVKLKKKSNGNLALKAESSITENEISILKAEIAKLKEENEQLSHESDVRIQDLQQEYNGLRIQYEKNMQEMEEKIHEQEAKNDESLHNKIEELEFALAEKEKLLASASESHVRKRVLELESLLDEQSNNYMIILKEKSELKEQMIKLTREREKLIDSYENQVDEMEKALKDKIFAVEESKHLDELNNLKLNREADQREIQDLKTKLEISEKTRASVQDTTLVILKQAQEDSAKIAMAHHERSLQSVLNEIRSDTGRKSRQEEGIESQLSESLLKISSLEKIIFDLECTNASLSDQVKSLTAELSSLQAINSQLEIVINESKHAWPPSQQSFEVLKERIRELEATSKKRESDIVLLLQESRASASQEFAQEKRDLLQILTRKDAEIISFKQELESLMGMIIRFKSDQRF